MTTLLLWLYISSCIARDHLCILLYRCSSISKHCGKLVSIISNSLWMTSLFFTTAPHHHHSTPCTYTHTHTAFHLSCQTILTPLIVFYLTPLLLYTQPQLLRTQLPLWLADGAAAITLSPAAIQGLSRTPQMVKAGSLFSHHHKVPKP